MAQMRDKIEELKSKDGRSGDFRSKEERDTVLNEYLEYVPVAKM